MPIQIGAKRESDFTDPIGMLGDCHRRIENFLRVLVVVASEAQGGAMSAEQRSAFASALGYFREGAPKHTADEEESLFPRLRGREDARLPRVLAMMEALEEDHVCAERLHGEVDGLGKAWLEQGRLDEAGAARLTAALEQLDSIYRRHIRTEDTELFPVAAAVLSEDERLAMGGEMRGRRAGRDQNPV